ncbi:hypothetical protein ACROAK_06980 [Shewanella oncorhynchi]|uniref:hypothetical protein n=1 Tax=Shewanella oncorhynchi TaxID=2726434 RepID=UPI003D79A133
MSDIADAAAIENEVHVKAALGVRQPSLPFTGRCHYCLTKITGASHFCDTDCRHDYERLKANGRT